MPGSGTRTFIDPDDYQASLRQAGIDLLVTSPGAFKARLTWTELDHLHLIRSQEELPRIAYLSLPPALSFVAFPTQSDPPPLWGGMELRSGDIMFHSRGERLHQRTRGPCFWSLITLAPRYLEDYGRALSGRELVPPPAGRILRPAPRDAARLQRLHSEACRLAETRPKTLAHPEVARGLEQELIHALVTCLTTADVHQDAAANSNRATIMVRFEEVLAEHLRRPPDLPEMCELIGVTDRTLRSCCAEFLGISPSRYLRLRRLKLVRSALRDADPDTASVAEVARRFGVTQLGRFAVAYRTAFGETPSSTLRHRHRIGIILAVVPDSA